MRGTGSAAETGRTVAPLINAFSGMKRGEGLGGGDSNGDGGGGDDGSSASSLILSRLIPLRCARV